MKPHHLIAGQAKNTATIVEAINVVHRSERRSFLCRGGSWPYGGDFVNPSGDSLLSAVLCCGSTSAETQGDRFVGGVSTTT